MKNPILVVKYFKKDALYTTQILTPNTESAIAVGQNSKVSNGFFGVDFSFNQDKQTWDLWVNAKKRVLSTDKKIKVSDSVSIMISEPPRLNVAPLTVDKGTVRKIQVKVLDAKGGYIESDLLPNKRKQTYKFAQTKLKISRPEGKDWEKIHSTPKGYSVFVKTVEVPNDSDLKKPVAFSLYEKDLIKKVAMAYAGVILLTLGIFYAHKLFQHFFNKDKNFDVVKIDENLLEEKRELIFKEKPKVVKPSETPVSKKKAVAKTVKAFEKSKKVEQGQPKKAIAEKKKTKSSGGGAKGTKVAVEGVNSNKMKITQGRTGAKGHYGQADATQSKLSKLSGLSGSIGFNASSTKKANNLYEKGTGGDFASLRKGSPTGKEGGSGIGGSGSGTHGIGSYKVGGVGTLSLGGAARGGGTGASLSQGKTSKGYVDGLSEEIIVAGGLDRSVIERIIRRNLGDINYCYERRLNARPNLSGVFEAQFSIGANGRVQNVKAARNSLADGILDQCIRNSIKNWQFPKPVGGTVVNVNYPFILKST